jgi:hypothetical protein
MARRLIEDAFKHFALMCFGDIEHEQYVDLQRTFYAGVATLLDIQFKHVSHGPEIEEADLQLMFDIKQELKDFAKATVLGLK